MILEIACLRERHLALFALERLLPRVLAHVRLQVVAVSRDVGTLGAVVVLGFLPRPAPTAL